MSAVKERRVERPGERGGGGDTSSKSVSDSLVFVALPAGNKEGRGAGESIRDRRYRHRVGRSVQASATPTCGWGGGGEGGGKGNRPSSSPPEVSYEPMKKVLTRG